MHSKLFPFLGGLALLAGPAMAQDCSTQYPPDPLASMAPGGACNALPPGAATARFPTFGGELGGARSIPGSGPAQAPGRRVTAATPPVTPRQQPVLRGAE